MRAKTIHLYVGKELFYYFSLALLSFTSILLLQRVLKLAELIFNREIAFLEVARLLFYLLPSFLIFTVPMAVITAILLTLGRLSSDNEILALKASGVSLWKMAPSVFFLSFLSYLFTTFLMVYALPWGNHSFKNLLFFLTNTRASIGIKERVFNDDFEGLVLYVNEILPGKKGMRGIFVSQRPENGESYDIFSERGCLIPDPESLTLTLRLFKGSIHKISRDFKSYQQILFDTYDINMDLKGGLSGRKKRKSEMTLKELRKKIEEVKDEKKALSLMVELHKKFSFPFSCLVFGLIGLALGGQPTLCGRSLALVLSLIVIFIYYVLQSLGQAMGESGKIPLLLGMWIPNVLLGVLGMWMLKKTAREHPLKILSFLEEKSQLLRERIRRGKGI